MGSVEAFVAEAVDAGPRMRRVIFDVPQLARLTLPGAGDEAVGIYVPDDDEGRNYTVRHRGPGDNQLTCDFVLHERGVASDWARRHGFKLRWAWVQEWGSFNGAHVHILLHVPPYLDPIFRPMPLRWAKRLLPASR